MIVRVVRHAAFRQLVKFCIVGATSATIDLGSLAFFMSRYPDVAWWKWASLTFFMGVTNGFIWNRLWTFKESRNASAARQYPVFLFTNTIGYFLNLSATKLFLILLTGQVIHASNPERSKVLLAKLLVIPLVAIWNFSAAKFLAFRAPKTPMAPPEVS